MEHECKIHVGNKVFLLHGWYTGRHPEGKIPKGTKGVVIEEDIFDCHIVDFQISEIAFVSTSVSNQVLLNISPPIEYDDKVVI